jgi:hypothetical protein
MTMMMSLATTNPNMTYTSTHMSTRKVTGAYVCPRVSGFSWVVGVDADTRRMEAAAAAVAVRCASGAQVCVRWAVRLPSEADFRFIS